MGQVHLNMSMSLDGFVAGSNVGIDLPMGAGGLRLHDWLFNATKSDVDAEVGREVFVTTGAVILGRRTFDVGVGVWGDTPYPTPCFVLTHEIREERIEKSGTFVFVNDGIEDALEKAKAAAGDKNVILMGAETARHYLKAGLVDEMQISLVPVLLGDGIRLFDHININTRHIELESTHVVASPNVTHLRFRVIR